MIDRLIKCFIHVLFTDSKSGSHFSAEKDEWGADHSSEIHIVGRIVLNLWRLLRHEVSEIKSCKTDILYIIQF